MEGRAKVRITDDAGGSMKSASRKPFEIPDNAKEPIVEIPGGAVEIVFTITIYCIGRY